jgi:hypothetical protein
MDCDPKKKEKLPLTFDNIKCVIQPGNKVTLAYGQTPNLHFQLN